MQGLKIQTNALPDLNLMKKIFFKHVFCFGNNNRQKAQLLINKDNMNQCDNKENFYDFFEILP